VTASRILIVDDEATLRTVLSAVLADAGYVVEACDSAEEALVHLEAQRYDLLLVDKNLPAMNGVDLTKIARERNLTAYALMITGYPSTSAVIEAINAGIDGFLVKPFKRVVSVVDEIKRLLDRPRRAAALQSYELRASLMQGRPISPTTSAVIVADKAKTRARLRYVFADGARDFATVELGIVAVVDRQPQVVAADDLEVLRRLVERAPRACALYAGPTPSFEVARGMLDLNPICVVDPQDLADPDGKS